MKEFDEKYLGLALRLAQRGLGQTGTNPSVGSVIVRNDADTGAGEIAGVGRTQPGGRPHAEAMALSIAGAKSLGATLYTTLDPCSHQGRSAPCTCAIINNGVRRVVSLSFDTNPLVAGRSAAILHDSGVQFERIEGLLKDRADYLNLGHSLRFTKKRPFVLLKLAVGSDGRISRGDGTPVWLTSPLSRQLGHLMRSETDAILVGSLTVVADNPDLTCRLPGLEQRSPVRIVLDSGLGISEATKLVESAGSTPLWVYFSQPVDSDRVQKLTGLGVNVIPCHHPTNGYGLDLSEVMTNLFEMGITRLLVEGGPTVIQSFFDNGYFDEVIVFKGKYPAGADGVIPFNGAGLDYLRNSEQLEWQEDRRIGTDLMTRYLRQGATKET